MTGQLAPVPARHGGSPFIRIVHAISTFAGWTAAALLVISLLITCQMIFSRSYLGNSTVWQTETVIFLVITAICIGLPYVQLVRGHVNVDLLPIFLPARLRFYWALAILLATIAVIGLMAWYSFDYTSDAYRRNWKSPSVWAPRIWPVWAGVTVGFSLMFLQLLADLYALLRRIDAPFSLEVK